MIMKLEDKDPQAIALGYVSDSVKADKKKYPSHSNEQRCNTCQLFSGKSADVTASCAVFSGKHVAGIGWCSAHAKKV
jgi:High potential iron-sulfur protein